MGAAGRFCWCCWWALGALAWFRGAAAATQEDPAHLFSEVFFCQRDDSPLLGLAQTLDNEELFWFDFLGSRWHSRLPDFQPEEQTRTAMANIKTQTDFCGKILDFLTNFSDQYILMPEAKGVPQVEVFTLLPLQLGKANTLVCSVSNLFPPSADVTWEHHGNPVTEGLAATQIFPIQGLNFQVFSYLNVTPQEEDIYSCTVKTPRDKFDSMAFWVPKDPVASDLLVNVACGVAAGFGVVFMMAGIVLLVQSYRTRTAD